MAHHAAHHPHQPLSLRLHTARRRLRKRYPRVFYTARRVRAHGPFTVYALTTLALMGYMLDTICRIP
jgi:hypothetical protein